MSDVAALIASLLTKDKSSWRPELQRAFPQDPTLVRECLARLTSARMRADQGGGGSPPRLGGRADARFEMIRCLDVGATAEVWMARDARLGRLVALKIFRHDDTQLQHALAEARCTADVVSEHVVRVLDVADDDCRPHIVMELVAERRQDDPSPDTLEVGTCAATPEGRATSTEEAVRWAIDVARGVHVAHARDVFHRDVKPENVMITPVHRKARITDFGLGIATRGALIVSSGEGSAVSICGTPEYMAPEQARGLPIALDPRERAADRKMLIAVDVWGVGALLYQLLCGKAPWQSTDHQDAWEVAREGSPAELPSHFVGERIPLRLRRVISRAMALDPRERYASPADFADDLEAVLRHEPTEFDTSRFVRFRLGVRRNPYPAIAALSALITLVVLLIGYIGVRRLEDRRDALEEQRVHLDARVADLTQQGALLATQRADLQERLDHTNQSLSKAESDLQVSQQSLRETKELIDKERSDASAALRQAFTTIDSLRNELKDTRAERDGLKRERDELQDERSTLLTDRNALMTERDTLKSERDGLKTEKTALTTERDSLKVERDNVRTERDTLRTERDTLSTARDTLTTERDTLKTERDTLKTERDTLKTERDRLKTEQTTLKTERDALKTERDALKTERDALKTERDAMKAERDAMKAERDALKKSGSGSDSSPQR